MRMVDNDELTAMEVIDDPRATLLVVTEYGFGKRTPLDEYKVQRRYGSGLMTLSSKNMSKTGEIIAARVVVPDDDLTLITAGGIALRTKIDSISIYGRATSGVQLIKMAHDDVLVGVAVVAAEEDADDEGGEGGEMPEGVVNEHMPDGMIDGLDESMDEGLDEGLIVLADDEPDFAPSDEDYDDEA